MKNIYKLNVGIFLVIKVAFAAQSCSQPDLPEYSMQVTTSKITYPHNTKVYYKCKDNYHFPSRQDQHKIICQDGDWEPKRFWKCTDKCQNRCGAHGFCVAVQTSEERKYKCQCDKNWAGEFCTTRSCDIPLLNDHLKVEIETGGCTSLASFGKCSLGTSIHYTCEDGFEITEGYTRDSCSHTGWTTDRSIYASLPVCKRVACKAKQFSDGSVHPMKLTYLSGETVRFECHDGFMLNLHSGGISTCTSKGTWDPFWPTCVELFCASPLRIDNGLKMHGQEFNVGSTVTYSCNVGYVLKGDRVLQCVTRGDTAVWKGVVPQCISLKEFRRQCENENKRATKTADGFVCSDVVKVTNQPIVVTARTSSAKPLTIVTATAGGLLLLLLVVITFVAFQRRRLSRHGRRRGRHRLSDDDRYAFLYYSNDFHLVLPSYDEAMQGRRPQPPPYPVNSAETSEGNADNSSPQHPDNEDHTYESIEDLQQERDRADQVRTTETTETSESSDIAPISETNDEPVYSRVCRANTNTAQNDESNINDNEDSANVESFDDTSPLVTQT